MLILAGVLLFLVFFTAIVLLVCHVKQGSRPPVSEPFRYGRSMIAMKGDRQEGKPPIPHCLLQSKTQELF